jgi:hypothetical protein
MSKFEKINELLQALKSDIRLEVILADLATEDLGMEDITVISNSLFKRNYHRDIEKTEEIEYGLARKKRLSFFVNRDGMYDQIPEDLIHQPSDSGNSSGTEKIVQEIKSQNELEKAARLFFMPFEQEFYWQRVRLEMEERLYLFETNSDLPADIFNDLWEFPDFLDKIQKSRLGVLLPVLHKIVGNLRLTGLIFSMITGDDTTISEWTPCRTVIPQDPELGKSRLGTDSILGGELVSTMTSLLVKISVLPEDVPDYLQGGKKIKIHEFLCNLFLPFERDIVFELDLSKTPVSFIIENETPYLGRLNFTTAI